MRYASPGGAKVSSPSRKCSQAAVSRVLAVSTQTAPERQLLARQEDEV
jgi:hypothetical protein